MRLKKRKTSQKWSAKMRKIENTEACWDYPYPGLRGETLRGRLSREGNKTFHFEKYMSGSYGQRMLSHLSTWLIYGEDTMNPELLAYWQRQGIRKELHENAADPDRTWYSYVPEKAIKEGTACPVWFIDHGKGRPILDAEAWGFVQLVAEKGIIVLVAEQGNSEEIVLDTILQASALYPVDLKRVYMVGHSFSGSCGSRIAVSLPEHFAGLCMIGAQFNPKDSAPECIRHTEELGMPRIDICGLTDRCFPVNKADGGPPSPQIIANVTPTTMALEDGYPEQIHWRRFNRCKVFPIEVMRDLDQTSADPVERMIGVPFEHTEIRILDGRKHYVGDIQDGDGITKFRMIGVEGAPHYPSAWAAELAWEFLHRFSRNTSSGEIEFQL